MSSNRPVTNLINRFIRIEHVDLTGRSTRALKEPTHAMHAGTPLYSYSFCPKKNSLKVHAWYRRYTPWYSMFQSRFAGLVASAIKFEPMTCFFRPRRTHGLSTNHAYEPRMPWTFLSVYYYTLTLFPACAWSTIRIVDHTLSQSCTS